MTRKFELVDAPHRNFRVEGQSDLTAAGRIDRGNWKDFAALGFLPLLTDIDRGMDASDIGKVPVA